MSKVSERVRFCVKFAFFLPGAAAAMHAPRQYMEDHATAWFPGVVPYFIGCGMAIAYMVHVVKWPRTPPKPPALSTERRAG